MLINPTTLSKEDITILKTIFRTIDTEKETVFVGTLYCIVQESPDLQDHLKFVSSGN